MTLKLFRTTGYSTILMPGEARLAPHPGWAVFAVSLWIGVACNVALWRALLDPQASAMAAAAATAVVTGAVTALALSALCWRRTFKPVASGLLMLAAAVTTGAWLQGGTPADPMSLAQSYWVFPGWASLIGWRVPLMLAVLGLLPMLVLWNTQLRRLTGPAQLRANLKALVLATLVIGGAVLLHWMRR
ncbi:hypothetical protein JI739_22700 [Ramlibacter sp. AW1]|uniref:DUF1705 domain-containing protein n=1 Tax=Ramlibacter aurantiacus TaxID=2801330 RepID=A0A936ZN04_9BURK|nr:hypothetical protein [Ramlibacter aurantiacus]MBL0423163.1 hypothetical protein [Ramlibacter aurantiacus]